jgi:hypothetical protein
VNATGEVAEGIQVTRHDGDRADDASVHSVGVACLSAEMMGHSGEVTNPSKKPPIAVRMLAEIYRGGIRNHGLLASMCRVMVGALRGRTEKMVAVVCKAAKLW